MSDRDATFDLLLVVWRRRFLIGVSIVVVGLLGLLLALFSSPEHRAKAVIVPLTEAKAFAVTPGTLPASSVDKAGSTEKYIAPFSLTAESLFNQLGVAVSRVASQRMAAPEEDEPSGQYRFDRINKEAERSLELEVVSADPQLAMDRAQSWISQSRQELVLEVAEQYEAVLTLRIRDVKWILSQTLAQESFGLKARRSRLTDELSVVRSMLSTAPQASEARTEILLLQENNPELLLDLGLPPYLMDRPTLQARVHQLEQQLEVLSGSVGKGAYYEPVAQYKAELEALQSVRGEFEHWETDLDSVDLLRFSVSPYVESQSGLKKTVLFVGAGIMLGLIFSMIWAFCAEAVRLAREKSV